MGIATEPTMSQQALPQRSAHQDESFLIAAICRGDRRLFHDLIRPYEESAYKIALSLLRDEADAEDVVQEACLKAFRNLRGFRMESRFGTWLISIVLNEARGRLRERKRMPTDSIDEHTVSGILSFVLADQSNLPSRRFEQSQTAAFLSQAIADLPEKYRDVFMLRAVDERSIGESAQVLGVSPSVVKVRLHRARRMLQRSLPRDYQLEQLCLAPMVSLESA